MSGSLDRLRSRRRLAPATPRQVEVRGRGKQLRPAHKTRADVRQHPLVPRRQGGRECTVWCQPLDLFAGALGASDGSKGQAVNAHARTCPHAPLATRLQQVEQRVEGARQALDGPDHQDEPGPPGGAVAAHGQAPSAALQPRQRLYTDWPTPCERRDAARTAGAGEPCAAAWAGTRTRGLRPRADSGGQAAQAHERQRRDQRYGRSRLAQSAGAAGPSRPGEPMQGRGSRGRLPRRGRADRARRRPPPLRRPADHLSAPEARALQPGGRPR